MFKELWRDVVVARGCAWPGFLENLVQFLDCEWLYSATSLFVAMTKPNALAFISLTPALIGNGRNLRSTSSTPGVYDKLCLWPSAGVKASLLHAAKVEANGSGTPQPVRSIFGLLVWKRSLSCTPRWVEASISHVGISSRSGQFELLSRARGVSKTALLQAVKRPHEEQNANVSLLVGAPRK